MNSNRFQADTEHLDIIATRMVIKESLSRSSKEDRPQERVSNANKRFLANTIRNTSSFNDMLKRSELESKDKPSYTQSRSTFSHAKLEKKRVVKVKTINSNAYRDLDININPVQEDTTRQLGALVKQGKLQKKKRKVESLKDLLGGDEGVFGPIPGRYPPKAPTKEEMRFEQGLPRENLEPW